jgi:hypothetical protein
MIQFDIEKHRAKLIAQRQNLEAELQRIQQITQQTQANLFATQGALQLLDMAAQEAGQPGDVPAPELPVDPAKPAETIAG